MLGLQGNGNSIGDESDNDESDKVTACPTVVPTERALI